MGHLKTSSPLRIIYMAFQRTGLRTIRNFAQKVCKLIAIFTPIIMRAYPDETNLHDALTVLNAACAAFVVEADSVLPVGD